LTRSHGQLFNRFDKAIAVPPTPSSAFHAVEKWIPAFAGMTADVMSKYR